MALPVTSGLVLDLAASSLGLANGSIVTSWPDSSTVGNNGVLTAYYNPTFVASATPSLTAAVSFVNAMFQFANTMFNGSSSAEIFGVIKAGGNTLNNPGFYMLGGNDNPYYSYTDGTVYDGSFTNSRYSFTPGVSISDWHIYQVYHDGTNRVTLIDGVVKSTVAAPFVIPSESGKPNIRVGGAMVPEFGWSGSIAEFVAYNRVLTSTERTQVYNYLVTQHLTAMAVSYRNISSPTMDLFVETLPPVVIQNVPEPPPVIVDVPEFNPIDVGFPNSPTVITQPMAVVYAPSMSDVSLQTLTPALAFSGVAHVSVPAFTDIDLFFESPTVIEFSVLSMTPVDGAVLPIANNLQFNVVLQVDNTDANTTVVVLVSSTHDFANIIANGTALAEDTEGNEPTTVTVQGDFIPGVTYYWKYVLLIGDVSITGSEIHTFTVDPEAVTTTYTGSWAITAGTAPPTIWFIYPAGGQVGEEITIYGQGLSRTNTQVMVGDKSAVIVSIDYIAADTSIPPIIDETTGTVSVAHDEIVFLIPDIPAPGDEVTVVV